MSKQRSVLSLDLGTSSAKALVVDDDGVVRGQGSATITTTHPEPGWAEQDPDAWLMAVSVAARQALAQATEGEVAAIAITGQMHGTVLLDEANTPLGPAIIWSDQRSSTQVERIEATYGEGLRERIGGPLASGYQAASLAWIREHQSKVWERIAHVLLPKDFIAFKLTGQYVSEPSDAVSTGLLDAERMDWEPSLVETIGVSAEWLPKIVSAGSVIGTLTEHGSTLLGCPIGTPVILAGGDAATAAVGAGVTQPGEMLVVLSTGAQVLTPTASYQASPPGHWHTWPTSSPEPAWNLVGTVLNGGNALTWARRRMGDAIAPSSDGVLCLPQFVGERGSPFARAAFLGLAEHHTGAHLHRAVLEGIAFSLATVAADLPGASQGQIVVGGGGSRIQPLLDILASVFGAVVSVPDVADLSTYGAARIAAETLGLSSARPTLNRASDPDSAGVAKYRELMAVYRDATRQLDEINRRLVTFQ